MANERRLIDAGELYDKVEEKYKNASGLSRPVYREFVDMVVDAPTVDAIIPVHCKDCVYWHHGDCYRLEPSRPDDFCSYGEKRCEDG